MQTHLDTISSRRDGDARAYAEFSARLDAALRTARTEVENAIRARANSTTVPGSGIHDPRGGTSSTSVVVHSDEFRVRLDVELARTPAVAPPSTLRTSGAAHPMASPDDSASFRLPTREKASPVIDQTGLGGDLDEVAGAWPHLPPLMRQAILRIIRSRSPGVREK